jgi:hypothetical protein
MASERLGKSSCWHNLSRQWIGTEPVRAGRASHTRPVNQQEGADDSEPDQRPPAGAVDVVQPANADRKARQERRDRKDRIDRSVLHVAEPDAERGIIDDRGDDPANDHRQDPIPEFRAAGAAAETDVVLEARYDRLPKIHDSPPLFFQALLYPRRQRLALCKKRNTVLDFRVS